MMKLNFNRIYSQPHSELIVYSSGAPIPATLKLVNTSVLPETIYSRNLAGENFIELRFNKETKELYEITIVAIQENTVSLGVCDESENDYYRCYIKDEDCELEFSSLIQIRRSEKSLRLSWGEEVSKKFTIAKNCVLGIDANGNLCSIMLVNLYSEIIYEILGF